MRVTRSKAKAKPDDMCLSQVGSVHDSITVETPNVLDAMSQIEHADQNDSPLNGQTAMFDIKEHSKDSQSPSLPRLRDSTNIASNPFVLKDQATPSKTLQSSTNKANHATAPNGTDVEQILDSATSISHDTPSTPSKTLSETPTDSSRTTALLPKSPANQLLSKERRAMRSTSDKENVQPEASTTASPELSATVATPQPDEQQARQVTVVHNLPPIVSQNMPDQVVSPCGNMVDVAITPVQPLDGPDNNNEDLRVEEPQISVPTDVESGGAEQTKSSRSLTTHPRHTTDHPQETTLSASSSSTDPMIKKEIHIPHAKPRPMSMKFPPPKAIPKGTKPPTVSTFKLPGEEVAARLKAAKEARMSQAQEKVASITAPANPPTRPPFKARPAPKFKDRSSIGLQVRPTATSRARESLMGGKPESGSADASPSSAGVKPASTVRPVSRSRPSISRPEALSRSTTTAPRQSLSTFERARMSKLAQGPGPAPTRNGKLHVESHGLASSTSTSRGPSSSRASIAPSATLSPTTSTTPATSTHGIEQGVANASTGTLKGKQGSSRASAAQNADLVKRKDKEDAAERAKRAREEASKRSREAVRKMTAAKGAKGVKTSLPPKADPSDEPAASIPPAGPTNEAELAVDAPAVDQTGPPTVLV